ncbi:ACP S-malonyltransferase [Massilia sp. LXY-6]|uniref:ACP S-malonyltransferase n=1 Tax=Massilia sp. LXY-6 TaxID=3379823 RepID=UPI003EE363B3
MTIRLAILCPGQGAQGAGMFDLAGADPSALARVEAWLRAADGPVSSTPLRELLGHPSAMFDNRCAQPLVVAATLMAWTMLAERLPRPTLVAGYSVGEVSAYAVAGALPLDEAVALAARRAAIMSEAAARSGEQGMAAVSGIAFEAARVLVAQAGCEPAIDTPGALVAGGLRENLDRLAALAPQAGASYKPLPITVASHTGLLAAAADPLRSLLQAHAAAPSLPLLAGVSASAVHDAAQAAELLARQTTTTIRWTDCLDAIAEARIDVALELGPGNALTRMLRERHPGIACRSVADFRSVKGIVAWIRAQDA